MATKITVGEPITFRLETYPGDDTGFYLRDDYRIPYDRYDIVSDELNTDYGPEFIVRHAWFDGVSQGITTSFPGSETEAPRKLTNWIPDCMASTPELVNSSHLGVLDIPEALYKGIANMYMTSFVAKTNPSRPEVPLIPFLGEGISDIQKIPERLMKKGRDGLNSSDQPNSLGIRFGILPLISDIMKLTQLSESVDKRTRELARLHNKGGARVRRTLRKGKTQLVIQAGEAGAQDRFLSGTTTIESSHLIYATGRWKPTHGTETYVRGGQVNRAAIRRMLLGVGSQKNVASYAADIWELLPWSWLADWFGNFGDYLKAHSNFNLANFSEGFVMKQSKTTRTFKCAQGTCKAHLLTKERCPATPSVSVDLPVLNGDQMSILTELARQSGSKRSYQGKPVRIR